MEIEAIMVFSTGKNLLELCQEFRALSRKMEEIPEDQKNGKEWERLTLEELTLSAQLSMVLRTLRQPGRCIRTYLECLQVCEDHGLEISEGQRTF